MTFRSLVAVAVSTILLTIPLVSGAKPNLHASVFPLLNNAGQTFCTAVSINEQERLYLTAGHCVAHAMEKKTTIWIRGGWALPVLVRFGNGEDLAVLQGQFGAPAVQLAKKASKVGEQIRIIGYPFGVPRSVEVQGLVAGRDIPVENYPISDFLDITVAGGNSGSPVFNSDGRVVGVLWGGYGESRIALAISWSVLARTVGGYFG